MQHYIWKTTERLWGRDFQQKLVHGGNKPETTGASRHIIPSCDVSPEWENTGTGYLLKKLSINVIGFAFSLL